jgi:hypothetical protein
MRPEFQVVKKKYEAELAQAQARVDLLKTKILLLEEVGKDVDGTLNFTAHDGPDYSQTGMKDAVLDALEKLNAAEKPVRLPDLAAYVKQHGYPNTRWLTGGLSTTLKRLSAGDNGKVLIVGSGRKRKFKLVVPAEKKISGVAASEGPVKQ